MKKAALLVSSILLFISIGATAKPISIKNLVQIPETTNQSSPSYYKFDILSPATNVFKNPDNSLTFFYPQLINSSNNKYKAHLNGDNNETRNNFCSSLEGQMSLITSYIQKNESNYRSTFQINHNGSTEYIKTKKVVSFIQCAEATNALPQFSTHTAQTVKAFYMSVKTKENLTTYSLPKIKLLKHFKSLDSRLSTALGFCALLGKSMTSFTEMPLSRGLSRTLNVNTLPTQTLGSKGQLINNIKSNQIISKITCSKNKRSIQEEKDFILNYVQNTP